ncbi:MAG: hypothetical protein KDD94_01915 [Calditrichaeota bacterium]|nr:hypothetical protein [Calditrichota bacterium]
MHYLLIALVIILSDTKQLPSKPQKGNAFKLIKHLTLTDPVGFYNSVTAAISPNGKIVLIDRGNHKIHVYDSHGKELLQFGKDGNGPGEINGGEDIICFDKTIVVYRGDYMMMFDYKGKLLKDTRVKLPAYGGTNFFKKDESIILQIPVSPYYDLFQITLNSNGQKLVV